MLDFPTLRRDIEGGELSALLPFLTPEFLTQLNHGNLAGWIDAITHAPEISASSYSLDQTVRIGEATDATKLELEELETLLKSFIPWRKGPFTLFGVEIDTEWKSNIKWERLRHQIEALEGRRVLDVGSGNGYYGLRMIEAGAASVIGVDPHLPYVIQFWLLKKYLPTIPAYVLPLTLEQLPQPLPYFDTVFSMGVIYHRRSPIDHLLQLKNCLRKGGQLVLESIIVDGVEGYSLTPGKRYARMTNVWFLPSVPTLINWLDKCGFTSIQLLDESTTTLQEQRKTQWMPYGSLDDALSEDQSMTTEGYPAPKRAVISAIKA